MRNYGLIWGVVKMNFDEATVEGFGHEWNRLDQSDLSDEELVKVFKKYFAIFPWDILPKRAVGFDLGCGSGRWAKLVAPKVEKLHCIDPSSALDVARSNLSQFNNCEFHSKTLDEIPLEFSSMDFGYSLGVLHHIPDPQAGLRKCVSHLKPGAPFLVYLYYAFENRPLWFRLIWILSDVLRRVISRLPYFIRYYISQVIALIVYLPLSKLSFFLDKLGINVSNFPLSYYKKSSFYTMRTDALDRFGTKLEHRFTRIQIQEMMENAGLKRIVFSDKEPFWCAVGVRREDKLPQI